MHTFGQDHLAQGQGSWQGRGKGPVFAVQVRTLEAMSDVFVRLGPSVFVVALRQPT